MFDKLLLSQAVLSQHVLQEVVTKLRAEQKAHPKALAQLEKQKQTLEKKVEAAERRQTVLERENEGLQEKLAKQEAEKATLQEQVCTLSWVNSQETVASIQTCLCR